MLDSVQRKIIELRELYPDATIKLFPKDNIDSGYNSLVATISVNNVDLAQVEIPFNKEDYGDIEMYKFLADSAIENCIDILGVSEMTKLGKRQQKKLEPVTSEKVKQEEETAIKVQEETQDNLAENTIIQDARDEDNQTQENEDDENKPKRGRPRKITRPEQQAFTESLIKNAKNVVTPNYEPQSYYDGFPRNIRNAFYHVSSEPRNMGKCMWEIYEDNPKYLTYLTNANLTPQKRADLSEDIKAAETILNYLKSENIN